MKKRDSSAENEKQISPDESDLPPLPTESEIKKRGEAYFAGRRSPRCDKAGLPLRDENGDFVYGEDMPYTITGYAAALGLSSLEELFSFPDMKRRILIKKALLRIEAYAEERLFDKDSFPGSKLFLSVNFRRWSEGSQGEEESDGEAAELFNRWGG